MVQFVASYLCEETGIVKLWNFEKTKHIWFHSYQEFTLPICWQPFHKFKFGKRKLAERNIFSWLLHSVNNSKRSDKLNYWSPFSSLRSVWDIFVIWANLHSKRNSDFGNGSGVKGWPPGFRDKMKRDRWKLDNENSWWVEKMIFIWDISCRAKLMFTALWTQAVCRTLGF